MSETTHDQTGQETPKERTQGRLVTNYPTAPEVLVFTAPYNVPVSFSQLLAMNGLTPEIIASLQGSGATEPEAASLKAEAKKE